MAKLSTLFIIALLLIFTLTCAARPEATMVKTQQKDYGERERIEIVEERCGGVSKEECLMRRTLVAHIDYIYTKEQHN